MLPCRLMMFVVVMLICCLRLPLALSALPMQLQLLVDALEDDPRPIECPSSTTEDALVLERFSRLIQFNTVSNPALPNKLQHPEEFDAMLKFLADAYPLVWQQLEVEQVGLAGYSRLFTWRGSDSSLNPVLFVSHYDVVPANDYGWTYPPFSGAIADGYVWGRGTLDIKFAVGALLEAATSLLQAGFRPVRTLMFSFGQDEEVGGQDAEAVAALLTSRGVRLEVVLDEGGGILHDGLPPWTHHPIALVSTSEKGFEQLDVVIRSAGGHASRPPTDGSDVAAQVSRLVTHLNRHPPAPQLLEPVAGMLQTLGAVTHLWALRPVLLRANLWPFNWLFACAFAAQRPEAAAQTRTTVAVTWINAGVADNVLPRQGIVSVNLRLAPGTTRADAILYLEKAVKAARVDASVTPRNGSHHAAAAPVTSARGVHFRLLKQAVQELWQYNGKAVTVAPNMLSGMTDSRHFASLSEHGVLRFAPSAINGTAGDLHRIHGTDERVAVSSYLRGLCTYRRLLQLFGQLGPQQ